MKRRVAIMFEIDGVPARTWLHEALQLAVPPSCRSAARIVMPSLRRGGLHAMKGEELRGKSRGSS